MRSIATFIADDRGADLIEYALLAGLVALAAVGTLGEVGTKVNDLYKKIRDAVNNAPVGGGAAAQ